MLTGRKYSGFGEYVDAFFLKLNGSIVSTHGDSILVREKSSDDLIQIAKYKVIDQKAGAGLIFSAGPPAWLY